MTTTPTPSLVSPPSPHFFPSDVQDAYHHGTHPIDPQAPVAPWPDDEDRDDAGDNADNNTENNRCVGDDADNDRQRWTMMRTMTDDNVDDDR
jgi:hypothetical protein